MSFTIFPAIDLRNGKVVRLEYGDPDRQTVFGDDPVATAQQWKDAGAEWIHVVNLDGAFGGAGAANWTVLEKITALGVKVQFGGGIRTLKDAALAIGRGVSRVVMGTVAIEDPDVVGDVVERFGAARVAVGIDARDGKVKTRGWQEATAVTPAELGLHMMAYGIETVIYTDISRDGVLTGVNAKATGELARETGLNVIASGGVATLDDVVNLSHMTSFGIGGVIIGRALYDGKVDLAEAIAATK